MTVPLPSGFRYSECEYLSFGLRSRISKRGLNTSMTNLPLGVRCLFTQERQASRSSRSRRWQIVLAGKITRGNFFPSSKSRISVLIHSTTVPSREDFLLASASMGSEISIPVIRNHSFAKGMATLPVPQASSRTGSPYFLARLTQKGMSWVKPWHRWS